MNDRSLVLDDMTTPTVLVVDDDPDWRALAELHVRLTPGVRLLGSVTTVPRAMDSVILQAPTVLLVGLGRPHAMERDDLTLLRMLAPTSALVVASVHGIEDARRRVGGLDAWFADKIEVLELVDTISEAATRQDTPSGG